MRAGYESGLTRPLMSRLITVSACEGVPG